MRYDFHPAARREYRDAAAFYEACRSGLGATFTVEVESTIERIMEDPNRWRMVEQDVRRCLTHVFPYAVLYSVEPDSVLILAVAHGSREPGYWRSRLGPDA